MITPKIAPCQILDQAPAAISNQPSANLARSARSPERACPPSVAEVGHRGAKFGSARSPDRPVLPSARRPRVSWRSVRIGSVSRASLPFPRSGDLGHRVSLIDYLTNRLLSTNRLLDYSTTSATTDPACGRTVTRLCGPISSSAALKASCAPLNGVIIQARTSSSAIPETR